MMRICLLLGPPCSGKSTLAARLSKDLDIPHIMASAHLRNVDRSQDTEAMDKQSVVRAVFVFVPYDGGCFCAPLLLEAPRC